MSGRSARRTAALEALRAWTLDLTGAMVVTGSTGLLDAQQGEREHPRGRGPR
ncbi:hypothetical protein [Streptomyces sp. NPDC046939]|uniref:hypothetical protein n=1 Tax=Streptomyces sp. NPDC046939 TaxID=3155376 RepID=UPI0033C26602